MDSKLIGAGIDLSGVARSWTLCDGVLCARKGASVTPVQAGGAWFWDTRRERGPCLYGPCVQTTFVAGWVVDGALWTPGPRPTKAV